MRISAFTPDVHNFSRIKSNLISEIWLYFMATKPSLMKRKTKGVMIAKSAVTDADVSLLVKDKEIQGKRDV